MKKIPKYCGNKEFFINNNEDDISDIEFLNEDETSNIIIENGDIQIENSAYSRPVRERRPPVRLNDYELR